MIRSRIQDIAEAILAGVIAGFEDEGVLVPEWSYVSPGPPPFDWGVCSLLTVHAENADRDNTTGGDPDPFEEDNARWLMRTARFVVTVGRCTPTLQNNGSPPPRAAMQASAAQVHGDATSVLSAVVAAYRAGLLGTSCHGLAYAGWQVIPAAGGIVASEVRFDVSLTAMG